MRRFFNIAALLFVFMFLLSGCWDSQDIEKMAFPIAATYDLAVPESSNSPACPQPGTVRVTVLTPNLSDKAKTESRVETVEACRIAAARGKRASETARRYFPGVFQVLIIGEDLAKKGLEAYLDSVFRVPVINDSLNIAISEGPAAPILYTPTDDHANIAFYLKPLLADASNKSFLVTANLFSYGITLAPGKNAVFPLIKKSGNEVVISGTAIFKKDRLHVKINKKDTRQLVFLRGIEAFGYVPFAAKTPAGQQIGTVRVKNSRKVKVERQGDQFQFTIDIKLRGEWWNEIQAPWQNRIPRRYWPP